MTTHLPALDQVPDFEPPLDDCARIEAELCALARRRRHAPVDAGAPAVDGTAYAVLRRLAEHGALRLTSLAALVDLDVSTVSRQVSALTASGLVDRERDPEDGRARRLLLTAAGQQCLEAARASRRAGLRRLLEHWPARDRAALARLLARLNADLERAGASPAIQTPHRTDRPEQS